MKHKQKVMHVLRSILRRGLPVIIGVASALITLELLLRIWSVAYVAKYTSGDTGETDDFVVLTLGESTTAGSTYDVWPVQLNKLLAEKFPARKIRVVNKAVPGTNTTVLVGNLDHQIKTIHPDVIVSMMGINDTESVAGKSSAYLPNTKNDVFILQRFFRTARRLVELSLSGLYDLSVNQNAEILNRKAEQYRLNGEYELSERYFLRCIGLEPDNANHYVMLAISYLDMHRISEAEEMLFKAQAVAPDAEGVYTELGNYYRDYGNVGLAEEMFQKALAINPQYGLAYGAYANLLYWYRNDPTTAMGMYEKAIALYPSITAPYFELAEIYKSAGRYDDAVALYEDVLRREERNSLASRELVNTRAVLSGGTVAGVSVFAGETTTRALPAVTAKNYRKLIALAKRYRIPVVAVQYPLSSPGPLTELANESKVMPGVTIEVAGNEKNFQEALKNMKYNDLFTDYFGGNFGHTTRDGSMLIAESVAAEVEKIIGAQTIAR